MTRQLCRVCGCPTEDPRDITHFRVCISRRNWPAWLQEAQGTRLEATPPLEATFNLMPTAGLPKTDAERRSDGIAAKARSDRFMDAMAVAGTTETPLPTVEQVSEVVHRSMSVEMCGLEGCTYMAPSEKAMAAHRRFAKQHKAVTA